MRVAYLGPRGTFSHEMAVKLYPQAELLPCTSLSQVINAVDPNTLAVLPFENSSNGSVRESIDSLCSSSGVHVQGSHWLPIHHFYYDFGRSNVKRIYSHPQVWGQVTRFLAPLIEQGVQLVDCDSTAAALVRAKQDPESAAIASEHAGKQLDLAPTPGTISDHFENKTHFLVLAHTAAPLQSPLLVVTPSKDVVRVVDALRSVCIVQQAGPQDRVFGTLNS